MKYATTMRRLSPLLAAAWLAAGLSFSALMLADDAPPAVPATQPATRRARRPLPTPGPPDVAAPKLGRDGNMDRNFAQRHAQILALDKKGGIDLVFLGDSITDGWNWTTMVDGKNLNNHELWDKYFSKYNAANFGIGGDRTEHILWRIDNGELDGISPKALVLLIGTNNIGSKQEDILKGVTKIIQEIRQKLPNTHLIVMGIFPRGQDPKVSNVKAMRDKITFVNAGLSKLDDGKMFRFVDIGDKLTSPDGTIPRVMMRDPPAYLHISYTGYGIWGDAITPLLDQWMK